MYEEYVEEHDIDGERIIRRGGANCGDEDYAVIACPHCRHVYLVEFEVDTIYVDASDLSKRTGDFERFRCIRCGGSMPDGLWNQPPFLVQWRELLASEWAWVAGDRTGPI
jgi:hypothetical protein